MVQCKMYRVILRCSTIQADTYPFAVETRGRREETDLQRNNICSALVEQDVPFVPADLAVTTAFGIRQRIHCTIPVKISLTTTSRVCPDQTPCDHFILSLAFSIHHCTCTSQVHQYVYNTLYIQQCISQYIMGLYVLSQNIRLWCFFYFFKSGQIFCNCTIYP